MKILHLDLETTGLDCENNNIIEIGAILVDTMDETFERRFQTYVKHEEYTINEFCLGLHKDKWDAIKKDGVPAINAFINLAKFIRTELDMERGEKWNFPIKITLAGKNVSGFDFQFLQADPAFPIFETNRIKFNHRMMDIGSMFVHPEDECVPDLKECCKRAGLGNVIVPHTALGDCELTVKCMRSAFNLRKTSHLC